MLWSKGSLIFLKKTSLILAKSEITALCYSVSFWQDLMLSSKGTQMHFWRICLNNTRLRKKILHKCSKLREFCKLWLKFSKLDTEKISFPRSHLCLDQSWNQKSRTSSCQSLQTFERTKSSLLRESAVSFWSQESLLGGIREDQEPFPILWAKINRPPLLRLKMTKRC